MACERPVPRKYFREVVVTAGDQSLIALYLTSGRSAKHKTCLKLVLLARCVAPSRTTTLSSLHALQTKEVRTGYNNKKIPAMISSGTTTTSNTTTATTTTTPASTTATATPPPPNRHFDAVLSLNPGGSTIQLSTFTTTASQRTLQTSTTAFSSDASISNTRPVRASSRGPMPAPP